MGPTGPGLPDSCLSFLRLETKQNKNPQAFKRKFKKRTLKFKCKRRAIRITQKLKRKE